jgi:hypothetical protein
LTRGALLSLLDSLLAAGLAAGLAARHLKCGHGWRLNCATAPQCLTEPRIGPSPRNDTSGGHTMTEKGGWDQP